MAISPDAKLLIHVDAIWQMEAIVRDLHAAEIPTEIFRRPKEYASFISGIGGESYQIFVAPADYARARSVIAHLLVEAVPETPRVVKRNYFRRVIALSFLGFLIPIFFNLLATYNYRLLTREEDVSTRSKHLALGVLVAFWILALLEVVVVRLSRM